ncbi:MAG TPA: hypothetical protein VLV78_21455 [Thermoanaerobaculia bacterium]|nr:hypothetical protein [Thermoanaerobaculia bacterium]
MPKPLRKKSTAPAIETVSREELVGRLRGQLAQFTDIENSICRVAAERGIFCKGFNRYSDAELRERYSWIVAKRPGMTREELEEIANDWQLAQQEVYDLPFACDVQRKLHDTCTGWNDFNNEQLAKFYYQLTGKEIQVA